MASWQAHLAVWILRLRFKPSLARADGDILRMRKLMTPPPIRIPRGVTITPAEVGGIAGEWVEGKRSEHTLLYLHGGGYFACSAETHRPITLGFAQQGFRVFAPNYRLAPEHPFPAAVEDAAAVWRGLIEQGNSPREMVVAGDSAGGGLALALLVASRDRGNPLPAAAALFSPWTDLAATGDSIRVNDRRCAMFAGAGIGPGARRYLAAEDARNPLASPLYADLSCFPPLLIHAGSDEVLLDDSRRLAERARAAGVAVELKIWPVVPHAWQLAYPMLPEARQSIREASAFLVGRALRLPASEARRMEAGESPAPPATGIHC
ncbi:MAG: alpha/beta hydrolase [Acidobacteriia bacterium]|nr:alpha/beta hydrolase [Terriglobia bacterium]